MLTNLSLVSGGAASLAVAFAIDDRQVDAQGVRAGGVFFCWDACTPHDAACWSCSVATCTAHLYQRHQLLSFKRSMRPRQQEQAAPDVRFNDLHQEFCRGPRHVCRSCGRLCYAKSGTKLQRSRQVSFGVLAGRHSSDFRFLSVQCFAFSGTRDRS